MDRELRVVTDDDDNIWQTVRLVAGALFLIFAGLGISALTIPIEQSNASSILTDKSQ